MSNDIYDYCNESIENMLKTQSFEWNKSHEDAIKYGFGFLKIDASGNVTHLSLDEVYDFVNKTKSNLEGEK